MMQSTRSVSVALLGALALWSFRAIAWPVDWSHDVESGREKFVQLSDVDWFEVEDTSIAEIEWQKASAELLIIGKKPGRTVVLLGAQGRIAAWRVRVSQGARRDEKLIASLKTACPGAIDSAMDDVELKVAIKTLTCYDVLSRTLQGDSYEARKIELVFDAEILQHQLRQLENALKPIAASKVKARYVGAGLVLEGDVTQAEYRKIMWVVLRNTLGRFSLDDRLRVQDDGKGDQKR